MNFLPLKFLLIVFFLVLQLSPVISQDSDLIAYIQGKFGLDYGLVTGTQFYNQYYRVLGHPYYKSDKLIHGRVEQSGKSYGDVWLNYDIYSQQLILEYQDNQDGTLMIILSPVHTGSFELGGYSFEKLSLDESGPLFYQVIRVDGLSCYIHSEKKINPIPNNPKYPETFTDPIHSYFLEYEDELFPFRNRKTFAAQFPDVYTREIKKYMKGNMIRFKWATPEQIEELLDYISSLVQSTAEE